MAWLEKFLSRSTKFDPVHPRDPGLSSMFGGLFSNTSSGISVTPQNAMQITAVYSAVSIISESIAMLPWDVYRINGDTRERVPNDSRHALLSRKPNRFQNSLEYRETMLSMLLLRGRAVAEIITDNKGVVTDLIPLHPDTIQPFKAPDGTIAIAHTPQGGKRRILLDGEFIDLRGLSLDGVNCLSPIDANAETLGISKAAEAYAGNYFGNSTVVSGVLETENNLSDTAYKRLREWTERHQGIGRSHNPAILEAGLKWKPVSLSPENSQLLLTRSYQVEDVARIFRIPAYKLQRMDSVKFNTTEQQAIDFVTDTLLPRIKRFELVHDNALFNPAENMGSEINLKGLLRGDSKTRAEFYRVMWNMGVYNANKILRLENENPIPYGDTYYVPVNVVPTDKLESIDQGTNNYARYNNIKPFIRSIFTRIYNAEKSATEKGKDAVSFFANHGKFIENISSPLVDSLSGNISTDELRAYFNRFYIEKMREFNELGHVKDESRIDLDTENFIKWVGENEQRL